MTTSKGPPVSCLVPTSYGSDGGRRVSGLRELPRGGVVACKADFETVIQLLCHAPSKIVFAVGVEQQTAVVIDRSVAFLDLNRCARIVSMTSSFNAGPLSSTTTSRIDVYPVQSQPIRETLLGGCRVDMGQQL